MFKLRKKPVEPKYYDSKYLTSKEEVEVLLHEVSAIGLKDFIAKLNKYEDPDYIISLKVEFIKDYYDDYDSKEVSLVISKHIPPEKIFDNDLKKFHEDLKNYKEWEKKNKVKIETELLRRERIKLEKAQQNVDKALKELNKAK